VRLVKRLTGVNIGPLVFRSVHKALGGRIRLLVSGAAALKPQTALDYHCLGLPAAGRRSYGVGRWVRGATVFQVAVPLQPLL
jgi:long-subunit acyl-CoA synthetase (AMP-forming)